MNEPLAVPGSVRDAADATSSDCAFYHQLAEEVQAALRAGRQPALDVLIARHPARAAEVCDIVTMLTALGADGADRGQEVLGDYRLLREVGRGGMGVVYEAEQVSLRRRVALKVLPLAAAVDERQLQRFRNESLAAAQLQHPHIVPVYAVGNDGGVHYYAMQFIEGQSLAQMIARLRNHEGPEQRQPGDGSQARSPGAARLPVGEPTRRDAAWFRAAAQLGLQAAEALQHAHQVGIVHRDIKPANLMLEGEPGVHGEPGVSTPGVRLWVADFGLAQVRSDARLTATGDVVGTLCYMSPEQALGRREAVDHRTDIYSLGATLYELLTLRPPFGGDDRQALVRRIADEEPAAPRRLAPGIPLDLETIVLKAMAKDPAERYASAQELADDLRLFLEDRPIRARRPGAGRRLARWARRHKPLTTAAAVLLSAALVSTGVAIPVLEHQRAEAEREVVEDLRRAELLQESGRYTEALVALGRAEGRLADRGPVPLRRRLERLRDDIALVFDLEETDLRTEAVHARQVDYAQADRAFAEAFRRHGLDPDQVGPAEMARRIRESASRVLVVTALDSWAFAREHLRPCDGASLLAVAQAADDDPWRRQLRELMVRYDGPGLDELTRRPDLAEQPPATLAILGRALLAAQMPHPAERVFRLAQQKYPADFRLNSALGSLLLQRGPADSLEAIGFLRVAVALRPRSPSAHNNLGLALADQGRLDEADQAYRQALALDPGCAEAASNRGLVLWAKRELTAAELACRDAVALRPGEANFWNNLGIVLQDRGRLDEAAEAYRQAITRNADHAEAHSNLGGILMAKSRPAEAAACFEQALRVKPDLGGAHYNLGLLRMFQRRLDEAADHFTKIVAAQPNGAPADADGRATPPAGAGKSQRRPSDCGMDVAYAYYQLGVVELLRGRLDEAAQTLRQAIRRRGEMGAAHYYLGLTLLRQGHMAEAVPGLKRGRELKFQAPCWPPELAQLIRYAEQLITLDASLDLVLQGQAAAGGPADQILRAQLCHECRRHFAAAARFYAAAFAARPDLEADPATGNRYNAACAAARAGCGQGADADKLSPSERDAFRRQALYWLQDDLAVWTERLKGSETAGSLVRHTLEHWLRDEDLTGVRSPEALARLPQPERESWQTLWRGVESLLERLARPPEPAPGTIP